MSHTAPAVLPIHALLRTETAALHRAVEAHLDLLRPCLTLTGYAEILSRFWCVYQPLEAALDPILAAELPGYYPERRRLPSLEADLAWLKVDPAGLRPHPHVPAIPDLAAALGALYVIEGSTLGGQVISRHLRLQFDLTPTRGASFFSGYGDATGARWREYLALLAQHDDRQRPDIVQAAQDTFRCFLEPA